MLETISLHFYVEILIASSRRIPATRHVILQCRAFALVELALRHINLTEEELSSSPIQLHVPSLLRAASEDLSAALAAHPSAESANRYYNLASSVGSWGDPASIMLAQEVLCYFGLALSCPESYLQTDGDLSNL